MQTTPRFSVDWFSNNIPTWNRYLKRFKGNEVNALEVGSYEGMSALWLLDNILTHAKSRMYCVDSFVKPSVHNTFLHNMTPYKGKYTLLKGESSVMLKKPEVLEAKFDIIYIDGDHHSRHVLEDAVLCFALLRPGGIMIFDDNTDNKEHDNRCPKPAIASFLTAYADEIKVHHIGWQVILSKRARPLKNKGACRSEYDS